MGIFTVIVVLALLATIGALLLGLFSMGSGGSFDRDHSVHFMYARIGLQSVAVLLMLLALYFSRS